MGPEAWLLVGLGVSAVLVGGAYFAGRRDGRAALDDRVQLGDERTMWERERHLATLGRLQGALEQGPDAAEAARVVLEAERLAYTARGAPTPRDEFRVLLGPRSPSSSDPGRGDSPGDPAREAGQAPPSGDEAGGLGA